MTKYIDQWNKCLHCFHRFELTGVSDNLCCICGKEYDRWIALDYEKENN